MEDTIEEVIVEVTENEEAVENQPVTITAEWVPGSGGHDHEATSDSLKPPLEIMGWIVNKEEADSLQGELPTVTNSEGKIRLRYRTPQFSGEIKLIAKTINAKSDTLRTEDQLTVEVPDLVPLPDGTHYAKVGRYTEP